MQLSNGDGGQNSNASGKPAVPYAGPRTVIDRPTVPSTVV